MDTEEFFFRCICLQDFFFFFKNLIRSKNGLIRNVKLDYLLQDIHTRKKVKIFQKLEREIEIIIFLFPTELVHLFSSPVAFLLDLYLKTCQLTKKHRRLSGRSSILSLIGGPLHYSHQSHLFIHVAAPLSHFKMKGEKM